MENSVRIKKILIISFLLIGMLLWIPNGKVELACSVNGEETNDDNSSWEYTKTVYLSNSTDIDGYQVLLKFKGTEFNYNESHQNGSDIRFFDEDENSLPFWIEKWNYNGETRIWIKVLKNGTNKISMLFGNDQAISASDGNSTFDFFDDFNDNNYTDKWEVKPNYQKGTPSFEERDGYLKINATVVSSIHSKFSANRSLIAEWRTRRVSGEGAILHLACSANTVWFANGWAYGSRFAIGSNGQQYGTGYRSLDYTNTDFYEMRGIHYNKTWRVSHGSTLDDPIRTDTLNLNNEVSDQSFKIILQSYGSIYNTYTQWDWVRLRRYSSQNIEASLSNFSLPNDDEVNQTTTGGFIEGFEKYTSGSFPNTWVKDANANDQNTNYIDNTINYTGSQSLRLFGAIGRSWASICYRSLNTSSPYTIEMSIRNGNENIYGAHPHRGGFGIRYGTSWVNPERWFVYHKGDGTVITGNGTFLGNYSNLVWYRWKVYYEKLDSTKVKTMYWLNGTYLMTEILPIKSNEDNMNNLQIWAQEGSAWYDDIIITPGQLNETNIQPISDPGGPYVGWEGSPVFFNGSGSSDEDDDDLLYRWDFDGDCSWDTNFSYNPITNHTWYDEHSGDIYLEVSDGKESNISSTSVTIENIAPTATFSNDGPKDEGGMVTFTFSDQFDPGTSDTFKYSFDLDNDGSFEILNRLYTSANYTWFDNGAHTIKGRIQDNDGGFSDYTMLVNINNVAPSVNFTASFPSLFVITGENVTFNGTFFDPGSNDTHNITWNFGDGNVSYGSLDTVHSFSEAGNHTVKLTVTDDDGGSNTYSLVVKINSTSEAIIELIDYVEGLNLANGIENSLDKKLENVFATLNDTKNGRNKNAINKLEAFINEVKAQSGNKISSDIAEKLIELAERLIAELSNKI